MSSKHRDGANNSGDTCYVCGKVFKSESILTKLFQEIHFGEEHFCDVCDYKTKRLRELTKHRKLYHSGEDAAAAVRPTLSCEVCGYQRKFKQNLEDHMDKMHRDGTYYCDQCDYTCRTKRHLREHKINHSAEPPPPCPTCGKTFDTKRHFNRETQREGFNVSFVISMIQVRRY